MGIFLTAELCVLLQDIKMEWIYVEWIIIEVGCRVRGVHCIILSTFVDVLKYWWYRVLNEYTHELMGGQIHFAV